MGQDGSQTPIGLIDVQVGQPVSVMLGGSHRDQGLQHLLVSCHVSAVLTDAKLEMICSY